MVSRGYLQLIYERGDLLKPSMAYNGMALHQASSNSTKWQTYSDAALIRTPEIRTLNMKRWWNACWQGRRFRWDKVTQLSLAFLWVFLVNIKLFFCNIDHFWLVHSVYIYMSMKQRCCLTKKQFSETPSKLWKQTLDLVLQVDVGWANSFASM